jgi:hypothetical protein
MLEAGRFAAEADALRLYRSIATLDPKAPLSRVVDAEPDWARASDFASELGLAQLAKRLEEAASSS